jgi:hypothetical protein
MTKRRIAVIIGSKSDLPQCLEGLLVLEKACKAGEIELVNGGIIISSVHRATTATLHLIKGLSESVQPPDVLITGAGRANHLTGMADAYLRYDLRDRRVLVVGVGFDDPVNPRYTQAAELSVSEVPGTQVVFEDRQDKFIGSHGFLRSCEFAVHGNLPAIRLPESKPQEFFRLEEAISQASDEILRKRPGS